MKLHTLLDLSGSIPSFMHVSDGKFHDVNVLDILAPEPGAPEPGAIYVLVATIRKQLGIQTRLYAMLQILSVLPFEEVPLYEVLTQSESRSADQPRPHQLPLFAP